MLLSIQTPSVNSTDLPSGSSAPVPVQLPCPWTPGGRARNSSSNSTFRELKETSIDPDVTRNVLTVRAERKPSVLPETEMLVSEPATGHILPAGDPRRQP
jgi:hypothetical protein